MLFKTEGTKQDKTRRGETRPGEPRRGEARRGETRHANNIDLLSYLYLHKERERPHHFAGVESLLCFFWAAADTNTNTNTNANTYTNPDKSTLTLRCRGEMDTTTAIMADYS